MYRDPIALAQEEKWKRESDPLEPPGLFSATEPPAGGWFTNPPHTIGGVPTYQEEAAWIREYIKKFGRAPTRNETVDWLTQQDSRGFNYFPGSTQYESGFRTPLEYEKAREFSLSEGPWSGSLVRPGGVVTTNEQGVPLYRWYNYEGTPGEAAIKQGLFYMPPETGETRGAAAWAVNKPGVKSRFSTMEGIYPQRVTLQQPQFEAPQSPYATSEIGKPKFEYPEPDQADVYEAKLSDYLTENLTRDQQIINQIKPLAQELITAMNMPASEEGKLWSTSAIKARIAQLQNQLSPVSKSAGEVFKIQKDKDGNATGVGFADSADLYSQIMKDAKSGNPLAMPFLDEAMAHQGGPRYNALLQDWESKRAKQYENYIDEMAVWTGRKAEAITAGNRSAYQQFQQNLSQTNIQEVENELVRFIYNNNFSNAAKAWLRENGQRLYSLWINAGKPGTFTQFIRDCMRY